MPLSLRIKKEGFSEIVTLLLISAFIEHEKNGSLAFGRKKKRTKEMGKQNAQRHRDKLLVVFVQIEQDLQSNTGHEGAGQ